MACLRRDESLPSPGQACKVAGAMVEAMGFENLFRKTRQARVCCTHICLLQAGPAASGVNHTALWPVCARRTSCAAPSFTGWALLDLDLCWSRAAEECKRRFDVSGRGCGHCGSHLPAAFFYQGASRCISCAREYDRLRSEGILAPAPPAEQQCSSAADATEHCQPSISARNAKPLQGCVRFAKSAVWTSNVKVGN